MILPPTARTILHRRFTTNSPGRCWSVHSSDAFRKLHTENEQLAIGKAMANLVVLEHHLWLNLTEIKDTDKMPHSPLPCLALGDGRSVEAGSVLLTQHMPK